MASSVRPILLNSKEFLQRLISSQATGSMNAAIIASSASLAQVQDVFADGRFKSTTISLGLDPRVGTKPVLSPPAIINAELGTNAEGAPILSLNFQIARQTVDGCGVVAFNVYRRQVAANNLPTAIESFNQTDFERLGFSQTRKGLFQPGKAAQNLVSPSLQPQSAINQNLNLLQQTSNAQQIGNVATSFPDFFQPPTFPSSLQFAKVGTVSLANFLQVAQTKEVYVQNDDTISLSFTDSNLQFGNAYDYTVTSFCQTGEESSNAVHLPVTVLNLAAINAPITFIAKQVLSTTIHLAGTIDPNDAVKNVYIFRRPSDDVVFQSLGIFQNVNNTFSFDDSSVEYLKTYTYRVILENIWGAVSQPSEITVICSSQKVIEKTRSFNLAMPVVLAAQDQNSSNILVTIFPNDPKVLFYQLTRRNLTNHEAGFSVPGNPSAGIQFWPINQFMVSSSVPSQITASNLANNSLPPNAQFASFVPPIVFTDQFVIPGNFYQYRVVGYDLFSNRTSYAFSSVAAGNQNSIRSPINLQYEVLRQTPFRLKLSWQDDNAALVASNQTSLDQKFLAANLQNFNLNQEQATFIENLLANTNDPSTLDLSSELAGFNLQNAQIASLQSALQNLKDQNNPISYVVQRRLLNQTNYDSFPATLSTFIIDEVSTSDAIPFSTGAVPDTFTTQSSIPLTGAFLSRSFGLPAFLINEQTYQYRVMAQTLNGATSNFTDPIPVLVQSTISPPINLSASCVNARVVPLVIQIVWDVDPLQARPDSWRVERQVNIPTDTFQVIGNAYLAPEFFDRSAQTGLNYIYRVRGVSALGQETDTAQVNIQV